MKTPAATTAPDPETKPAGKPKRTPRRTRKTTERTPANDKFAEVFARTNNASEAVRQAYPDASYSPEYTRVKAHDLLTKPNVQRAIQEHRAKLERLTGPSLVRLEEIIVSGEDKEAGTNARFIVEQTLGKATQRVQHVGTYAHVTYDLSGGKAGPVPRDVLAKLGMTPDTDTPAE